MCRKILGVLALVALSVATVFVTSALAAKRAKSQRSGQSVVRIPPPVRFDPTLEAMPPEKVVSKSTGVSDAEIARRVGVQLSKDSAVPGRAKVLIHPRVQGGTEELHQFFATTFAKSDPKPDDRYAYYQFIEDAGHRMVGWNTTLLTMEPSGEGWNVTVSVHPQIAPKGGGIGYTPDHRTETYYFGAGELRFLQGSQLAKRRFLFVD